MEMNDNQKIYDAMLIKAFRNDVNMYTLRAWLKPYNFDINDGLLKRCPNPIYYPLRVRVMVATFMKKLSDRLWDTEKKDDIKTLKWMDCIELGKHNYKVESEIVNLKRKSNNSRRKQGFLHENIMAQKASNQWNVTK
jgi:hypothetical protein